MTENSAQSDRPIRLAIIGCGVVTRSCHLPALARVPGMAVAYLCDQNPANAAGLKAEFGLSSAAVAEHLPEILGKVDAALVAVPPRYHAAVSMQLLESGIDVFCEKPLALTAAEGSKMVETAERYGRRLAVGLCRRFEPNNAVLQRLVADGFLGEIQEITAEFGSVLNWPMPTASYYSRETTRGGVFFDTGIHLVDLILWMFGSLDNIEFEDDSYGGVESNAELRGTLQVQGHNVPCRLTFSWTHMLNNGIRVVGAEGWARTSFRDTDFVALYRRVAGEPMEWLLYPEPPPAPFTGSDAYVDQLLDFAEAIRGQRPPFVAAASTIKALSVIEKAYSVRRPMAQPWVENHSR